MTNIGDGSGGSGRDTARKRPRPPQTREPRQDRTRSARRDSSDPTGSKDAAARRATSGRQVPRSSVSKRAGSDRSKSQETPRRASPGAARARVSKPGAEPLVRRVGSTERKARGPRQEPSRQTAKPRPGEEGAPTDKRRRASAGRILAVGLLCFLIWLLFDANKLYHSAETGQIGVRRTVAISILRPIAAVSNALRISGPVNAADSALGSCGIGGAPVCGNSGSGPGSTTIPVTSTSTTIPRTVVVVSRQTTGYMGFLAAPHLGGPPPAPPAPAWPPPIASPTLRHPLVLLSIGDSIGEDLGYGLGDVFSTDPYVTVIQKGVEDTGLARADYYNWPAALAVDLRRYHPKIVVVMMGANDAQAFYQNGGYISFAMPPSADPTWWNAYRARVALVMREATDAGAHVMWVGLPPMGPASTVPHGFPSQVSTIFYSEAVAHSGVEYFSAAKVLSTKKGAFLAYKTIGGSYEQVRSSDGVHLLPPGYDLLARDLVLPMEHDWQVNLRVG